MKNYLAEILVAGAGTITLALSAWYFGGRQKNEADKIDPISRGADTSVGTMERILKLQEDLMKKANDTADQEKAHRETCEKQVEELTKRVFELEKIHKINE